MSNEIDNPFNLSFLLWSQKVNRNEWVDEVSRWCQCELLRARRLLSGSIKPTNDEILSIAQAVGVEPEQFVYENLLDGVSILKENINFLLGTLEHGEQSRLAETLKVSVGTVRKWKGGAQPPNKENQVGMLKYFHLPSQTDLSCIPLFLSLDPIGVHAKKAWLLDRLNHIDDDLLDQYFPALKKILE